MNGIAEHPVFRPTVNGKIAFLLILLEKLHLPKICDYVFQLTQLKIFGTVGHCLFLLFLMFPLYQKSGDFHRKTVHL